MIRGVFDHVVEVLAGRAFSVNIRLQLGRV